MSHKAEEIVYRIRQLYCMQSPFYPQYQIEIERRQTQQGFFCFFVFVFVFVLALPKMTPGHSWVRRKGRKQIMSQTHYLSLVISHIYEALRSIPAFIPTFQIKEIMSQHRSSRRQGWSDISDVTGLGWFKEWLMKNQNTATLQGLWGLDRGNSSLVSKV